MPLVAKRKLRQPWRDAVAARARSTDVVARFDALVAEGTDEAAAAYHVLEQSALLWRVDEPGLVRPSGRDADEVPAV